MNGTKQLKTIEAIVFKRKPFNEKDILARFFSKELGLFSVIIRGAKSSKSKLNAGSLNFSHGTYEVMSNQHGISSLRSFASVKQYENIFTDIFLNAYASYVLDLVDHAFVDYEEQTEYFALTSDILDLINQKKDPEIITQIFELKFLDAFGVPPELAHCVFCDKAQGTFDYSLEAGGIVCSDHYHLVNSREHADSKTISLIRTMALIPLAQLGNIQVDDHNKLNTRKLIDKIYRQTVELDLKSKKYLMELLNNTSF